jgi:hypothetical protein
MEGLSQGEVLSAAYPLARAPGSAASQGLLVVEMVTDAVCACGRLWGGSRPRANPVWGTGRGGDDRVRQSRI